MIGDYLSQITPDCTSGTLSTPVHSSISYQSGRYQKVTVFDDMNESRISIDDDYVFFSDVKWENLAEDDPRIVINYLLDVDKGNGIVRSFKWEHPTDGYTYVVRNRKLPSIVHKPPNLWYVSASFKLLGIM